MGSEGVGGIHGGLDATGAALIRATEEFFREVVDRDFVALESALAHDSRLQEGTAVGGRSVTGIDKVLEKLEDISGRVNRAGFKKAENVVLMRNGAQTRFILKTKIGFMSLSVGWRIEWSCGLITRIVVEKDPKSEELFMLDDTEVPVAVTSPQSSSPAGTATAQDVGLGTDIIDSDSNSLSDAGRPICDKTDKATSDTMRASHENAPGSEVLGASHDSTGAKERRASSESVQGLVEYNLPILSGDLDKSSSPAPRCGFEDIAKMMNVDLHSPYLVPQPPALAPMLKIAVLNCQHLSSRRVRILERPVNAYVVVTVGKSSHKTPICYRTSNPDFSSLEGETSFIFETPNTIEFRQNGFIGIEVRDVYPIGDAYDLLAHLRVPMIALKSVVDSTSSEIVRLKLNQLGKFHKFRGIRKDSPASEEATIELSMSKIDIMQWWVVEETRAREEAAEVSRREDRALKKAAAIARSPQLLHHSRKLQQQTNSVSGAQGEGLGAGSRAVRDMSYDHTYERKSDGEGFTPVPKEAWMDGENCIRCGQEFSFFDWKHHCRFCGQVVCDSCSCYELVVSTGQKKRACDLCYLDGTKEIIARNSELSQRESKSTHSSSSSSTPRHSAAARDSSSGAAMNETTYAPASVAKHATPSDVDDAVGSRVKGSEAFPSHSGLDARPSDAEKDDACAIM